MKIQDAIDQGRTAFTNNIKHVSEVKRVLKPAKYNKKLGDGTFRKGSFKGMPLFALTLEERATCDNSCPLYSQCYGNHMPFAHRFIVDAEFYLRVEDEIARLNGKYPNGFVIRLHVLGDFPSRTYVQWWSDMLTRYPALHAYGYTHRRGPIRDAIDNAFAKYAGRFVIFQSDGDLAWSPRPCANANDSRLPVCPVQTGKAASCLDCALCTNARIRGVSWEIH